MAHAPKSGFSYFFQGISLIAQPGLRKFVLIPIVVNIILLVALWSLMIHEMGYWLNRLDVWLPAWLVWLNFIIWPLFILLLFVITAYCFTLLANWISAPFLGLLSERVQMHLKGVPLPETSWSQLLKDLPSIIGRQIRLALYYLPRAILLIIIMFIPGLNIISGVLWFLFGAWMLAVQYLDYPLDNNKKSFAQLIKFAKQYRMDSLGFGICALVGTMIPVVNLFVIPAAVAGATAMAVSSSQPTD